MERLKQRRETRDERRGKLIVPLNSLYVRSKNEKIASYLLFVICYLLFPSGVLAANVINNQNDIPTDPSDVTNLVNRLQSMVNILAGVIAFLTILWGALAYITSGGNEERIKKAKSILTYGIGGALLIAFANALIKMLIMVLGGKIG